MPAPRSLPALLAALAIAGAAPGLAAEDPETPPLATSDSPFVRRHAGDSVQWRPWGPEAFAIARKEKKPLFVTVGYDSCHWCARMQEESFNNPAIAAVLNRHFVNVLVDRIERPDLNGLYMTYLNSVQGVGGWPVNVWLTPEGIPFSAGSYFSPTPPTNGSPSFPKVIDHIVAQWTRFPDYIDGQSKRDFEKIRERLEAADAPSGDAPDPMAVELATAGYEFLSAGFDPVNGGFTHPAKFPQGSNFRFLVHLAATETDGSFRQRQILKMLTLNARALARGGLFDHVEGGFHRYAIDPAWQLPRFEKTLDVQHDITTALLDLHTLSPDPLYAETIRRTLDFTTRELRLPSGLFQAALHSDSKAAPDAEAPTEGARYTWTYDAFAAAVAPEDLPVLAEVFQIRPDGNLDPGASENADLARTNLLRRRTDESGLAERLGLTEAELASTVSRGLGRLSEARARRPRPDPDTNTITSWNALIASSFARSYRILGDPADLEVAEKCVEALLSTRFDRASGRLTHTGEPEGVVLAFSYSATIQALLDLYDATLDPRHIETAADLQARQIEFFWDAEAGGFFETLADAPQMLLRLKNLGTSPETGTNDVGVTNLRRLGDLLADPALLDRSAAIERFALPRLQRLPGLSPEVLVSALLRGQEALQVLINAPADSDFTADVLRILASRPRGRIAVFAGGTPEAEAGILFKNNTPLREAAASLETQPSVLVGRGFRFGPPLASTEGLENALAAP